MPAIVVSPYVYGDSNEVFISRWLGPCNFSSVSWSSSNCTAVDAERFGGFSAGVPESSSICGNFDPVKRNATRLIDLLKALCETSVISNCTVILEHLPLFSDFIESVLCKFPAKTFVKVWFNNRGWISLPAYMNALYNAMLRHHLPSNANPLDYGITLINHPLNLTAAQKLQSSSRMPVIDMMKPMVFLLSMTAVASTFVVFEVEEKMSGAKAMQLIAGVNPCLYVTVNILWDLVEKRISFIFCSMLAMTVIAHLCSTFIQIPSMGAIKFMVANYFAGAIGVFVTFLFMNLSLQFPVYRKHWYNSKNLVTAVNKLSFDVYAGECFGFLGVNGAGKTSTFSMLTGKSSITSGKAFIYNQSLALEIETMTGIRSAEASVYAADWKYHTDNRSSNLRRWLAVVVDDLIKLLHLEPFADRLSCKYSGGNKRKLSTAIALCGMPQLIFLDEPSTGMDPASKRLLWNCLLKLVKSGRSLMLTSHSMEECEALCSRVGIMVKGRLQCTGTIQELKSRYGSGYSMSIRLKRGHEDQQQALTAHFRSRFDDIRVTDRFANVVKYRLPSEQNSLSDILDCILNAYDNFPVENYSLSQTSLDDVFINFAQITS
ncbi:unnamed protein product [Soboliphyme baturini]|uniref:ABC transporter domain-containing protein n=1 Tax=Soboliphyme baturini TaxID=241478 RepID=A0A183IFS7_9BILA|nr:unnamed protein product [Soboliphyme baturini]